ncbi:MAG: hypothetical protein ACLR2G_06720 [Phascolarctobacterium faecium]
MELGYIQTLMQAGAAITAPLCRLFGSTPGMLAGGEVCISSTNRNFPENGTCRWQDISGSPLLWQLRH